MTLVGRAHTTYTRESWSHVPPKCKGDWGVSLARPLLLTNNPTLEEGEPQSLEDSSACLPTWEWSRERGGSGRDICHSHQALSFTRKAASRPLDLIFRFCLCSSPTLVPCDRSGARVPVWILTALNSAFPKVCLGTHHHMTTGSNLYVESLPV